MYVPYPQLTYFSSNISTKTVKMYRTYFQFEAITYYVPTVSYKMWYSTDGIPVVSHRLSHSSLAVRQLYYFTHKIFNCLAKLKMNLFNEYLFEVLFHHKMLTILFYTRHCWKVIICFTEL